MRRGTALCKRIASVLIAAMICSTIPVMANAEDRTVTATADAYSSSANPTQCYSLATNLAVTANKENVCKTYIGFNVGKVPTGEKVRVTLRLTPTKVKYGVTDEGEEKKGVVSVWGLATHNWKQGSLTANNAPKTGSKLAALNIAENQMCEVDVTDYVTKNISSEGYISFMLAEDAATGSEFAFASKESATGKPELFIDVDYVAPESGDAEPTPSATAAPAKDYNEIFTKGELKDEIAKPMKTRSPYIDYPDLSEIPEDIYVEEFTTVRTNKHLVNYVYGETTAVAKMLKGRNTAQMTYTVALSQSNPNKMLIGSDCELMYRTEDGGNTCYVASEGLNGDAVNDVEFYPDNDSIAFCVTATYSLAIGSGQWVHHGISKSTDGGKTWELKPTNLQSPMTNGCRKIIAFGGKMENGIRPIYVAGQNKSGIWRSMDLGETWECIFENISSYQLETYDDTVSFAYLNGEESVIYISHDRGETWEDATGTLKGNTIRCAAIDPANRDHWTAAGTRSAASGGGMAVWESLDAGKTWTYIAGQEDMKINGLVNVEYGPVDPKTNKARLYLNANQNQFVLRYSDDGGRTWNLPYYYDDVEYEQTAGGYWVCPIAFSEKYPDMVVSGVQSLSVSYDKGENFYCRAFGRSGARYVHLLVDTENPSDMIFSHIDIGLARTIPTAEDQWYPMTSMEAMFAANLPVINTVYGAGRDPLNHDRIIFAYGQWNGQHKVLESLDNGFNFEFTGESIPAGEELYWHPQDPNVVYYGSRRSDDGGRTWKALAKAVGGMFKTNGDIVYGITGSYLYISEDRGENWELACTQSLGGVDSAKNILVDSEDPYRAYVGTYASGFWIVDHGTASHKYTNAGLLPSAVCKDGLTVEGLAQDPKDPNHIIVGGRHIGTTEPTQGFYESFDRGETFRLIEIPPPGDIFRIDFHPVYPVVYFGTSGGTYAYEYENYDKERPDCYYTDTEGTFCEAEAKWLADNDIIGEDADIDFGRALELNKDRYIYEGDFLDLVLTTEDAVATHTDVVFNDVDLGHRFYAQVQMGYENGLVLKSDADENGNLNLLWKKLTQGMCAKYLVRLLAMNKIDTSVSAEEINKYISDTTDKDTAYAIAVLHKRGVLTDDDGFEFSADKTITRGEMVYMFARTLKQYK